MRTALLILLLAATARADTNLYARVQLDLVTRNLSFTVALSNAITGHVATNSPRAGRTIAYTVSAEPDGQFRVHALYEFNSLAVATNLFALTRLQQNANLRGRIVLYCQPAEFGALADWGGADGDTRAKRTEVSW